MFLNENKQGTLLNDDGVIARVSVRLTDQGHGRIIYWKGSFTLTDMQLNPGGTYQLKLDDGRTGDILVNSCEILPPNKCMVSFTITEEWIMEMPPVDSAP